MFRKVNKGHNEEDGHGGLMITPLLDLLVALIPILIIGVVMTRINVVDVAVSKPVSVLKKVTPSNFDLLLKVKGTEVELVLNGKTRSKFVKSNADFATSLHNEFVSIKKAFPQEFEFKIEPESEVALDNIMEIIDSAREIRKGDPEMTRKDEATGKEVRVKYLFPKVVLRGVYS